ncbi:nitrile hydratase accessory protein [Microbaculum sp. FT89]|uniref:nitrile hydratase accessory protein n=1 Tax=Microbaculum sp. FT89 TaxID=3447298 RepID=UPI003F53D236
MSPPEAPRPEIAAALETLPSLPRDRDGPVFAEPWHAQAFAMAVELNAGGHFTWSEWADTLGAELKRAGPRATGDDAYYSAWLSALERLLDRKGIVPEAERSGREIAWDRAAKATPHGQPIELGAENGGKAG